MWGISCTCERQVGIYGEFYCVRLILKKGVILQHLQNFGRNQFWII